MVEGSDSSQLDGRPESNDRADSLTPEDIAWVDSCLIKGMPDMLDDEWNHVKTALLEILDLYPEALEHSAAVVSDNALGVGGTNDNDIDMLPSNNVEEEPTFPSGDDDNPVLMNEAGIASDDPQNHDDIETFLSLSYRKNPFLPTYNNEVRGKENIQAESPHDFSEIEPEPLVNDIFRVWDLNLPYVEDELIEQLNKALSENSESIPSLNDNKALSENSESVSSLNDNLSVLKDFKVELLDDLINSISNLSLEHNSYK